jgi:serine/threonine-protein kinase
VATTDREEQPVQPVRVTDVLSGRYRLVEKVGEGGMGTVYVAHDEELHRQVAVKLLAASLVNEPDVVERFEREARLTAGLDHPNIVPIYDVGRHQGRPFIVMKLLQGDTLAGHLLHQGGLTSDETQQVMRQLASGLDYLHGQGFIHRDIKAGNIFVGADGHATILDFGILRSRTATQGLTRTGMVMGTPQYMAPEQALGLQDVDHRVDLYALGVVLFECLTGTLPFEADSELRLIQMQAHTPPPDIIERAPWISRPVAEVVRKALAKDPAERFGSGHDLVQALETAYRESRGHPAAPPRSAQGVPTTSPSLRQLSSGGVSVVPAQGVALRRPSPPPVAPRRRAGVVVALAAGVLVVGGGLATRAWLDDDARPQPEVLAVDAGSQAVEAEPPGAGASTLPDAGTVDVEPEVPRKPPPAARPRRPGRVNLVTTHGGDSYWAFVTIDGVPRGRTPLLLDLPAGTHLVRVERPGFKPQSREIKVASGKSTVVRIDLSP